MRSLSVFILVAVSLCAAIWPANASLQCYECIGRDCEDWDKVPLVDCNLNEPETTTPKDEIGSTTESSSPGSESTGATGSTESSISTDATKTTDAAETTEGSTTTAVSDGTTTDATEGSTTTAESEATTTDATEATTEHETSEANEATTDASTDITGSTETTPIATTDAESTAITEESSTTEEASRPTEVTTASEHTAPTEESTTESSSETESTTDDTVKATTESEPKASPVHAAVQAAADVLKPQMTLPAAGVRSRLARRTLAAQAADLLIRNYRALEQDVKYRTTACYSIVKDGTLHRGCVRIPEEQSACQAVREQVGLPEDSVGDLCDVCQMDGCNGSASLRISLASLLLLLGLGLRGLL